MATVAFRETVTRGISDTPSQAPLPRMSLLWSSPASHVSRTLLFCLSDKLRCSGGSGTSGHRKGNISTVPGVAFVPSPPQARGSPPPSAPSADSGVHMSRPLGPGPSALFYVCSLLGLTATTRPVSRAALATCQHSWGAVLAPSLDLGSDQEWAGLLYWKRKGWPWKMLRPTWETELGMTNFKSVDAHGHLWYFTVKATVKRHLIPHGSSSKTWL